MHTQGPLHAQHQYKRIFRHSFELLPRHESPELIFLMIQAHKFLLLYRAEVLRPQVRGQELVPLSALTLYSWWLSRPFSLLRLRQIVLLFGLVLDLELSHYPFSTYFSRFY